MIASFKHLFGTDTVIAICIHLLTQYCLLYLMEFNFLSSLGLSLQPYFKRRRSECPLIALLRPPLLKPHNLQQSCKRASFGKGRALLTCSIYTNLETCRKTTKELRSIEDERSEPVLPTQTSKFATELQKGLIQQRASSQELLEPAFRPLMHAPHNLQQKNRGASVPVGTGQGT